MFTSALKSFNSNISSNYTISPQPSSTAGSWNIFDAKRKQTGKAASVFVFDRKSLDPSRSSGASLGGRGNAASLKRAHDEVLERLKREASSLARLRHPSILELVEPVEETRNGGLMFATEPVTASLASLLQEKDVQERSGGVGGRGSRYVVEEADGTRKRRELEIDELEIQKGLLQLGKGLEFLHESAGLVHANLTPDSILINVKGDWKISGLAFCGPHESSSAATSLAPISLHEVLNHDSRLPMTVQLNLDFTSPDFVLDNTLTAAADIFSLGLLIVALYNFPHTSPISTGGSLSSYKRLFANSSTTPSRNNNFLVPSSHPLPPKLASELLPRLITRRPAQRMSAREFQEASYFDNILVSTIRFLDALPAKTANEKMQFMRGLPRILPQFPKSVLEKKVLPALLDEMKDKDLLAPIMTNIFAIIKTLPTGKRAFTAIVSRLREVFITKHPAERDASREAGLMIMLENMHTAAENCPGKEFRDDILPIIISALESPTHGIVDAALGTLSSVLAVLDFSTIKHELFPTIAAVFAKTSSLAIKIRGLEAFYTLCGGSKSSDAAADDDLNGIGVPDHKAVSSATSSSAVLDKFTIQEKVVPLLKAIKTKEPGVMMAALAVFRQVGEVADPEFMAMEVLPTLWMMSLGPLLDLQQFGAFMDLIRRLGSRIEREQKKKLQELRTSRSAVGGRKGLAGSGIASSAMGDRNGLTNGEEADFESLVSGRKAATNGVGTETDLMNDFATTSSRQSGVGTQNSTHLGGVAPPSFSWQTSSTTSAPAPPPFGALRPQQQSLAAASASRTVTPDQTLASFAPLTPRSQFSQPLQPARPGTSAGTLPLRSAQLQQQQIDLNGPMSLGLGAGAGTTTVDWSAASNASRSAWPAAQKTPSYSLPPPPPGQTPAGRAQSAVSGPGSGSSGGLERYESLL